MTYAGVPGNGIWWVNSQTLYGGTADSDPRKTTYNGLALSQTIETLPKVTDESTTNTTANPPTASKDTITTTYSASFGTVQSVLDKAGAVQMSKVTYSYNYSTGSLTGTDTWVGGGQPDIVTSSTVDAFGRPLTSTDGNGNVTNYSYPIDTASEFKTVMTPPVGPQQVVDDQIAFGFTDVETMVGTMVESRTRTYTDLGGQTVRVDKFFNNPGVASNNPALAGNAYTGTSGYTPYYTLTTDALGTETETFDDALGRPYETLMGTGSTLTLISVDQYDNGGAGDGNITQTTAYPNSGVTAAVGFWASSSGANTTGQQQTTTYYDWRDRLLASNNTVALTVNTLDNLGETKRTAIYNASNVTVSTSGGIVQINPISEEDTGLRAQADYSIDDRGRIYKSAQDWVDQSNGDVDTSQQLATSYFYDMDGDAVETDAPGGLVTYNVFNGAGEITMTDVGGGSNSGKSAPMNLASGTATIYDADGNGTKIVTTNYGSASGIASVQDTVTHWFDAVDNLVATADSGTNAPPTSLPVSNTSSTALISTWNYNYTAGSLIVTATDPDGIVTVNNYNALDQLTQSSTAGKVTGYEYNPDGEQTSVSVNNVTSTGTVPETTLYFYGKNGAHSPSGTLNQSLLTQVSYSDGSFATYSYSNVGQTITMSDRSGNTHSYSYDPVGRQTLDAVTAFGTGVDQTIRALGTTYDALNDVLSQTSYSNSNGTGEVNQLALAYNGFGQVITDSETSDTPAVPTSTVQYVYNQSGNYSRLTAEVYPDSTTAVVYGYDNSTLDNEISRTDSTSAGTASSSTGSLVITSGTTLETDTYLGQSLVIGRALPQTGIVETTTLDSFDRANGMSWQQSGGAIPNMDTYQYTYDNDGNVKTRTDVGGSSGTEAAPVQTLGYDGLGVLTSFSAGGTNTTYTVDSMGNRTSSATFNGSNEQSNESYTGGNTTSLPVGSGATANITYDAWGRIVSFSENIIAMQPQTQTITYSYDAAGRAIVTAVSLTTNAAVGSASTTETDTTDTVYDAASHPIQENETIYKGETDSEGFGSGGVTGTLQNQYIWSDADGRLIMRISNSGAAQVYALTDVRGDVTSLVANTASSGPANWNVVERESYNADGVPTAYSVNWSPVTNTSSTVDVTIGAYNWKFLWQGQQGTLLYGSYVVYCSPAGEGWDDPKQDRSLTPAPDAPANGNLYNIQDAEQSYIDNSILPNWYYEAADVALPVLQVAAAVGSFVPVTAPYAIPISIALNGASMYASGSSYGQIGESVAIQAALMYGPLGIIKALPFTARAATAAYEGTLATYEAAGEFIGSLDGAGARFAQGLASGLSQPTGMLAFAFGGQGAIGAMRVYNGLAAGFAELAPDELRMWQLIEQNSVGSDVVAELEYVHQLKSYAVTDIAELNRQINGQIEALNTILDNEGMAGLKARILNYSDEVEAAGRQYVKTLGSAGDGQAWLHGPDMALGGGPAHIIGTGDARINSIIGGNASK